MKGLIFRELYLARKNLLSCSAIFLLFYGISCLTGLSLRFGNIAKYASPETREVLRTMLPGCLFACAAILIVTAGEATFQVCTKDLETPWLRYALASPWGSAGMSAQSICPTSADGICAPYQRPFPPGLPGTLGLFRFHAFSALLSVPKLFFPVIYDGPAATYFFVSKRDRH